MVDLTLDREITYNGIRYKIVEILRSDYLLVILKDDFDKGEFPLQTFLIPGE